MDLPIPSNFNVGNARGGGDCFYDSFAQCLNQQKRRKRKISAKVLRLKCKKYAQQELLNDKSWLRKALEYEKQTLDWYISCIQYCANDLKMQPIWGRPEIEGRIICDHFNVRLHVIEKHIIENEEICLDEVIDRNGSRSVNSIDYRAKDIAHIINKGSDHFEPVLRSKAGISNPIHVAGGHNKVNKFQKQKSNGPIVVYPAKSKTSGGHIAPKVENIIPQQRNIVQFREGYSGVGDVRVKYIWHDKMVDKSGYKCVESVDFDEDDTMHMVKNCDLLFDPNEAEDTLKSNANNYSDTADCDPNEHTSSIIFGHNTGDDKANLGVELINVIVSNDYETLKLVSIRNYLEQGVDINFRDANKENNTALHTAVYLNLKLVLKFLLANGADKSIKNCHNDTPLDVATKFKMESCMKILNSAKPPNNTKSGDENINVKLEVLQQNQDVPLPLTQAEMGELTHRSEKQKQFSDDEIENIIKKGVFENKNDLEAIKSLLITELAGSQINDADNHKIEQKYIKCCFGLFLHEARDVKIEDMNGIQQIIGKLNGINEISNIFHPFNELDSYKRLMRHSKLIKKEHEVVYLREFKTNCFSNTLACADFMKREIQFLEAFYNFLNGIKNTQAIITELNLQEFCNGKFGFKDLLQKVNSLGNIFNCENLKALKEAINEIGNTNMHLMDSFKQIINEYVKPVRIERKPIDGRLVIEISGINITISNVIATVEDQLLTYPEVKEVRFFAAAVVHNDKNIDNVDIWHGKNIVVFSKVLRIYGKVTWNVSGKGSDFIYHSRAHDSEGVGDRQGQPGNDGMAGESGGNVLIRAGEIENAENFLVISEGGKGGKGQDGGNGIHGDDGYTITVEELKMIFPPPAKLRAAQRYPLILKNVSNITADMLEIKKAWYKDCKSRNPQQIVKDLERLRGTDLDTDVFLQVTTAKGNEITFSYISGSTSTMCQSYLLYKGSRGKAGGAGGAYGLGGEGGYAGEVTIFSSDSPSAIAKQGENGVNGIGGLYGKFGKNGWDVGYMDYAMNISRTIGIFVKKNDWPEYFGKNKDARLQLTYYDTNDSYRVICSDRHNRGCKDRFVKITRLADPLKIQKVYQERANRTTFTRQSHAEASRKKAISYDQIDKSYTKIIQSEHFLNTSVDEIKDRLLQEMAEIDKEVIEETIEITVQRRVDSNVHRKRCNKSAPIAMPKVFVSHLCQFSDVYHKLQWISLSSNGRTNDYLLLNNIELDIQQLNELFNVFECQKADYGKENLNAGNTRKTVQDVIYIEQILKAKYQLATLTEIPGKVRPYLAGLYQAHETHVAYLSKHKNDSSRCNIRHKYLGKLDKYIIKGDEVKGENVRNFHDFCKTLADNLFEELKKTTEDASSKFKPSSRTINQLSDLTGNNDDNKLQSTTFNEVISQHPEYAALVQTLKFCLSGGILDNSQTNIKKYTDKYNDLAQKEEHGLITFPQSFIKLNFEFCSSKNVVEVLLNDIRRGPISSAYREILARIFDVNILLYIQNNDNTLNTISDHNPAAETKLCYTLSNSHFAPLDYNESYLTLTTARKLLCKRIVEDIYTIQRKEDYDKYLEKLPHLFNNCILYEQQPSYISGGNFADIVHRISLYYPKAHVREMNARLGKLQVSSHVSEIKAILGSILKRFECEGRHISIHEIFYIIDCILTSVTEEKDELDTYFWIVLAHQQRNWIVEFVLLDLEHYFKTPLNDKEKWRECLSDIQNKYILLLFKKKLDDQLPTNRIQIHHVDNILFLLSKVSNDIFDLSHLPLTEWIIMLKESYFTSILLKLATWEVSELLPTACYYLLSIENIYGNALTSKLIEILEAKGSEISDNITYLLRNISSESWNLNDEELNIISSHGFALWIHMKNTCTRETRDRNIDELTTLIKDNSNSCGKIINNLAQHKAIVIAIKNEYQNLLHKYPDDTSYTDADRRRAAQNKTIAIAQIMRVIYLKRGLKLRDTQLLAIVILLTNAGNTLLQVSTGEGKSLIAVTAAIVKALNGEKSDIITSSSVLAKRDAYDNRDIYGTFGINVADNCSKDIEERKRVYSSNPVVYGDIASFQRDYLLDRFYEKNILGDRKFENVIIDEVDSMLLDNGNNVLYLSHDVAGLDKLERIYIIIWQWINTPALRHSDISISKVLDVEKIKEAILDNLKCTIKKEDIKMIDSSLDSQQINNIWENLIEQNVLDSYGNIQANQSEREDKVHIVHLSNDVNICNRISYLINQRLERNKHLKVPNYLKQFVEQHLSAWIDNAIRAFFMEEGRDYVLDVDRTGTCSDLNPNITIIDRDTGTDQANSQWDEALHQFLQLKHGCKLSMQSLKAVFKSNVSYFKLYDKLSGFTGTLGSQAERELLKEVHNVDFVTIPTARQRAFDEYKPYICKDESEWVEKIGAECTEMVCNKRSCLIICDTISEVETLYKVLREIHGNNVHAYKRDYEQLTVVNGETGLPTEQIIIATNLAGRGTDIMLADELKLSGGLHICLTYLPNNTRIEQQAYGRSARCGDKGSGRLIVIDPECKQSGFSHMIALKTERDNAECHHVAQTKQYFYQHITIEEYMFNLFTEKYIYLLKEINDLEHGKKELMRIALNSCLDRWAFWLDTNSHFIKEAIDTKNTSFLYSTLKTFLSKLSALRYTDLTCWINMDHDTIPNQILIPRAIQMGKWFIAYGKHEKAIELFERVIEQEPYFSEAALYYKAYSMITQAKPLDKIKNELIKAAKLIDDHKTFSIHAAALVDSFKQSTPTSIMQIDAYKDQKTNEATAYHVFLQSIEYILGHIVTPQSFINDIINESVAQVVYQDLLESGILKKANIQFSKADHDFKYCCHDYGIQVDQFEKFLKDRDKTEIDEKSFEKDLAKDIALPSQESLWALLVQKNVFCNEQKYIAIKEGILPPTTEAKQVFDIHESKYPTHALLHAEFAEQGYTLYEKGAFKSYFGHEVYKTLKDQNQLHIVKKATITPTDFQSVQLPSYDSITLNDFKKTNITQDDAQTILQDLVNQGILQKQRIDEYRLKKQFCFIKLPIHPLYENEVRALMSNCFAYRIALQKMERAAKTGVRSIKLPLLSNPHQDLMWELVSRNILAPVNVSCEQKNFKTILKNMYNINMTEDDVKNMLSETLNICDINHLVEKKWLSRVELSNKFTINSSKMRNELSLSNQHVEIITRAFDHRLLLSNKAAIQSILNTLVGLSCKYNDATKRGFCLKPMSQCVIPRQSLPAEEIHVFSLNGLNDVLTLTGQNPLTMLVIGACKTATGIAMEYTGLSIVMKLLDEFTETGNTKFIHDGINEMKYAVNVLKSPYFNWNDRSIRKVLRHVTTSADSLCTAADLQTATLSGGDFDKSDQELRVNDLVRHVIPATASIIDQENLATLIESHVQGFCENIMTKALSKLEKHADIPSFLHCLHTAHTVFHNSAISIIELSKPILSHKSFEGKWQDVSQEIMRPIMRELTEAIRTSWNRENSSLNILNNILNSLEQKCNSIAFASIETVIRKFISDFTSQINRDFACRKYVEQDVDCELCTNVLGFLKSWLREEITKYILKPILDEIIKYFTKVIRFQMATIVKSHRLASDLTCHTELKSQFYNASQNINEEPHYPIAELEMYFKKRFHDNLLKIRSMSNDPNLLAAMIEDNVPMDMECLETFVKVISCMTNQTGIPPVGFTVIVVGKGIERRKFVSAAYGTETNILYLEYNKNNFSFLDKNNYMKNYDSIITFLSEHVYTSRGSTVEKIKSDIITLLRQSTLGHSQLRKKCTEESYLNEDAEYKSPYEHELWTYNPSTDVDLRNAYPISHEESAISQLSKAYSIALYKINEKMKELGSKSNPIQLEFSEFTTTKYGVIQFPHKHGIPFKQVEANYPMQFKAEREIRVPGVKNKVSYHMTMDCSMISTFAELGQPCGPHVRYRVGRVGREGPDGVTGFVLLNENDVIFMRNGEQMLSKYTFTPSNIFNGCLDRTFSKSLTELSLKLPCIPKDLNAVPKSLSASIETSKRGSKALTSIPIASDYWMKDTHKLIQIPLPKEKKYKFW